MFASSVAAAVASAPRLVLEPSTVHRGHSVRIHGTLAACPQGDTVTLISKAFPSGHTFAGVSSESTTVGKEGAYSLTVRIPRNRRPGTYTVSGRCGGGNFGSLTLRVHR